MPRGRPKKNSEIPLAEEAETLAEQGSVEAKEGTVLPEDNKKRDKLAAVMRLVNTNVKGASMDYGSTIPIRARGSFGHPSIDKRTGGGFPYGLHSCFWGSKSCGKTTLTLDIIATAQAVGKTCVLINGERSFDAEYAKKRGVNVEQLAVLDVEKLEDGLDIIIKLCREKAADLIVLDSIHGLAPKAELYEGKAEKEKSTADSNMALRARAMTQYFEMVTPFISSAQCAVILIGQSRMDLSGFVKLETLTGGHALVHNCRLIMRLRRGQGADAPTEKVKTGKFNDKGKEIIETVKTGFDLVIRIDKSQLKGCVEGTEMHVPFIYETGIDD